MEKSSRWDLRLTRLNGLVHRVIDENVLFFRLNNVISKGENSKRPSLMFLFAIFSPLSTEKRHMTINIDGLLVFQSF